MSRLRNFIVLRRRASADAMRARRHRLAARRAALLARPAVLSPFQPEPLHVGDAETARSLARGTISLGGAVLTLTQATPWKVPLRDAALHDALHGFDWLDDAMVAGTKDLDQLRGWIGDWIALHGMGQGACWTPRLAGRRLMRLGPAMPRLLNGIPPAQGRRLRRLLASHISFLAARVRGEPDLLAGVEAAAGLVIGALCVERRQRALRRGCAVLSQAAATVAAPDAMADRRIDVAAATFTYLAWITHNLEAAGHRAEPAQLDALRVLGPALRSVRLGDGGLPRFHGGAAAPAGLPNETLDTAFALAGARARGPRVDSFLGYDRLSAGQMVVVVDAAAPPDDSPHAAASTLGLEIGIGRHRLMGSVGPGHRVGGEWPIASRATAAHSAVEIEGASAARLAPVSALTTRYGRAVVAGPGTVETERSSDLDGLWFRGDHDGYLDRFGLMVSRRLYLAHSGVDLRGEETVSCPSQSARQRFDRVAQDGVVAFRVRLHLAPSIEAEPILHGRALRLQLPDGRPWVFRGIGGPIDLVDGVWIDTGRRRAGATKQIVLSGEARAYYGRLTWSLSRADESAEALRAPSR